MNVLDRYDACLRRYERVKLKISFSRKFVLSRKSKLSGQGVPKVLLHHIFMIYVPVVKGSVSTAFAV